MIKIPTYKEHNNGDAILDRYLYLAALILPFSPEAVIGNNMLRVDGKEIKADNFRTESKKSPRKRDKTYTDLLNEYGVTTPAKNKAERFAQDELLAAKIIQRHSLALYKYLYNVKNTTVSLTAVPGMKKKNLRTLLTAKMDALPPNLKAIGTINSCSSDILLQQVFRYECFSQHVEALKLLKDMDVPVCPYCNRQYTFTVSGITGTSRPQFDHYLSKTKYPYFAVSLLNLVPSCGLCNQSKSDREETVLYPYSDELGYDVAFQTKNVTNFTYLFGDKTAIDGFEVVLEPVVPNLDAAFLNRLENSKKFFHLPELYNGHKDYVLSLFFKNYVFSDDYIELLCQQFPDLFPTKEEVKGLLYLMDIDKENWGKRSLCKLTHDIDLEIS